MGGGSLPCWKSASQPAPAPKDVADQDVLPDPTAEAVAEFGETLAKAERYAQLLATDGVTRGIIGPRETARLWDRHLVNCALVADFLPEQGELVDIGSGAGLPGIVLALLRPALHVVLLEPLLRRSVFLEECVRELDLPNVTVIRARAEEKAAAGIRADVATARAVASLEKLVGWAARLLNPGGELLAIKGQSAAEELTAAGPVLARLGVASAEVLQAGHGRVVSATTIVRVVMGGHGREERTGAQRSRRGVA
jgi:16S rRNA (guanine527-N7)-methyltransferase